MPGHTNVFLVINLGCEMLYVIDQRLKAQCITVEKSAQVLRDLTCVLLDPKLLDQLMLPASNNSVTDDADSAASEAADDVDDDDDADSNTNRNHRASKKHRSSRRRRPVHLLSHTQCRRLLSDIACCSLMRLDPTSMEKLWDLMVMVLKWQLTLMTMRNGDESTQPLLDLTFRHMDGIARLLPDTRKTTLVDCTKRHLIEFWDQHGDEERLRVLDSMRLWLRPFSVKISLLMRLGFQRPDATFETAIDSDFGRYYAEHVGENVYTKHAYVTKLTTTTEVGGRKQQQPRNGLRAVAEPQQRTHEIDALAAQLSVTTLGATSTSSSSPKTRRILKPVPPPVVLMNGSGSRVLNESSTSTTSSSSPTRSSITTVQGDAVSKPATAEEATATGATAAAAAGGEEPTSGNNGMILDEVVFDLDAFNRKRRADLRAAGETIITIDSRDSEFEHVQRTCSSLDAIIDRFSLDFFRPMGDVGIIEEFDCTRELLRLLDEGC